MSVDLTESKLIPHNMLFVIPSWGDLLGYLNKATYFQTEEFHEKVEQTILEFQIRFKHLIRED